MKRIALAVALLVSLAAPAWAGFDEGTAAYHRSDWLGPIPTLAPLWRGFPFALPRFEQDVMFITQIQKKSSQV